jgi:hypothetical protein
MVILDYDKAKSH